MRIQKKNSSAIVPTRGSEHAAGLDLYSLNWAKVFPRERALVDTGIIFEIPKMHYGRVAPRSGLAFNRGLDVMAGVIDSDYRDSVKVLLINHSDRPVELPAGTRIAQLIIYPIAMPELELVELLDETERNQGGFGSTGT